MESPLLSLLTREGVLVKVSVRYWRGCKKLKAEDLGLKSADISDRLISLVTSDCYPGNPPNTWRCSKAVPMR